MTRTAKKQKELTPEEKLARALVPAEDQPYSIPENWYWTTIETINSFNSRSLDPRKHPGDYYELYSVPNYDNDYPEIIQGSTIKSSKQVVAKDDVLICKINPRINRVWKVSQYTDYPLLASSEWIVVRNRLLNPDYLMWYFKTPVFREYMLSNVSGVGGSLMRAQPKYVKTYPLPIPPLAEQQRIVDRIESLFSKLDEAKEKAQSVIDSYEDRKSAILHQAFSGKLTEEWRRNNNIVFSETWLNKQLGDYAENQYGYTEKSSSENIGPHYLRITDIQDGGVKWEEVPYCVIDNELRENYVLKKGDIVVARTGATTGKSYMITDDVDSVFASYLIRISVIDKEQLDTGYLYYYFQSSEYWRQITELSSGIAQPGVNGNKLKTLRLPIPNIEEQGEIVKVLDNILPTERHAKEVAEQMLESVDATKKSILSQAFYGQLGTADSNDEPADSTLKRMLSEF